MKTITVILAVLPLTAALGDIDRTMWKTPVEIDAPRSAEFVAERGSAAQQRSLEAFRKEITQCDQLPPEKAIPILFEAVFKLPKYNIYQLRERIAVFDLARDKLLTLPGHAQYFADLIEAERAALKPADYRGNYDRNRRMYLAETLCHLPSPETVRVLGFYLHDERDDPLPGAIRQSDVLPEPTTSIYAMMGLTALGIRGAPFPEGSFFSSHSTAELAQFRAWFAPIKAGESAFSFKGQAVEYRFKPDGTWVSTPIANPPDDRPKPTPKAPPRKHPPPPAPAVAKPADTATTGDAPVWPWLLGLALLVVPAAVWFLKARRRP